MSAAHGGGTAGPAPALRLEDLSRSPNALARHYRRFRVADRLLLSGHSHQAWPDRAFAGQRQAWLDAARLVDEKWGAAFACADEVRQGFARLLDDEEGAIALAGSTHELVVRFLSALPLRARPRLVTTTGEFHTIRRQLDRLAEAGLEIVRVPHLPAGTLADRLGAAVDARTAAVLASCVLFENAHIVPGLGEVLERCRGEGAELLVDAYHALNVVPWSVRAERMEGAFVVGGGYKYCQLGEGNAFLRVPRGCELRPVVTGWFSEFGALTASPAVERVTYGNGADRFAGATYDPTSHYRGAAVFAFFEEQKLTPALLRRVSQHQVGLLARAFDDLDLDERVVTRDRAVPLAGLGGFLALRTIAAPELDRSLRRRGVHVDHRGDVLRLGPAPYLSDRQIQDAVGLLGEVVRERG